jgi:hypothetical protein
MTNSVIGTEGFVAWLYAVIYNRILNACKNILIKLTIHIIGVILMILGIYFLIATMPSLTSIAGLFLLLIGQFLFCPCLIIKALHLIYQPKFSNLDLPTPFYTVP